MLGISKQDLQFMLRIENETELHLFLTKYKAIVDSNDKINVRESLKSLR